MADGDRIKRDRFVTTRWSVVLRAGHSAANEIEEVWNEIAQNYWYPLYAFCRRQGANDHDAQDLTQGFFVHLLNGSRLNSISPDKGRFRTFLLRAFKNYVSNHHRDHKRIVRGGGKPLMPLDHVEADTRYLRSQREGESLDRAFDREWAEALLERVKQRLANHYERANKGAVFAEIKMHLTPRNDAESHADLGKKLKLSVAAVGMLIVRMRTRYRKMLLEEVAATVDDPADVEDELQNLMTVFRNAS